MFDKNLTFNFNSISYSKFLNNLQQSSMTNSNQAYPNLDFFRQSLPHSFHQMYLAKKRQAFTYQAIFFGLGFIFLFLAALIYFKTTNWKCDFYLGHAEFVKACAYSFCLLMTTITCSIGYYIYPEKETIFALIYSVKKSLTRLHKERKRTTRFGLISNQTSTKSLISGVSSQELYYQALDKIQEHQDETLQLVERIHISRRIPWKVKEQLFNQAICELHAHLVNTIQTFQQFHLQTQAG